MKGNVEPTLATLHPDEEALASAKNTPNELV